VNLQKIQLTGVDTFERMATPRFRPRIAFVRDESSGAGTSPKDPERLLIVEDDYLVSTQIEAALNEAGYEVVGMANTADEALALAAQYRPALVVMDIRLSGKRDGIDAALELAQTHNIRCVFATAHNTADAHSRAKPAAPLAWLAKPYTMPALVRAVREALHNLRTADDVDRITPRPRTS
jgi:two-component system, response regulator PdtaR